jgi:outer membrane protein assembly factor BamD
MKNILLLNIALLIVFTSCSEYQKVLKSDDADYKYKKGLEYLEKKDYLRASNLFDAVAIYYKGTEKSEELLYNMAMASLGQKDYYTAGSYFKKYVKTYPKGKFVVDSKFMIGMCYYSDSPDARLDQEATEEAIDAFQEFLELYPESEKVQLATKYLEEMSNKMAQKLTINARLYFNLGNYLGNNYQSAIITAQNALRKYPSSTYREQLSMIILESKYQEAIYSVEEKRLERFRGVVDEYYTFSNEFPDGKLKKKADKILNESKKQLKE